ncbi:unnamed protein product [Moneuplotes crassus]|uniref:Uncharacterized protein n=1 Tax=Euplotes crassus TaxID=5936 RepID=A0AAD1XS41_EUPCR|nr:unnamed protein product [Moneuplotes crassus]
MFLYILLHFISSAALLCTGMLVEEFGSLETWVASLFLEKAFKLATVLALGEICLFAYVCFSLPFGFACCSFLSLFLLSSSLECEISQASKALESFPSELLLLESELSTTFCTTTKLELEASLPAPTLCGESWGFCTKQFSFCNFSVDFNLPSLFLKSISDVTCVLRFSPSSCTMLPLECVSSLLKDCAEPSGEPNCAIILVFDFSVFCEDKEGTSLSSCSPSRLIRALFLTG